MWRKALLANYDEDLSLRKRPKDVKVGVSRDFRPADAMHDGIASPVPNWMFEVTFYWNEWAQKEFGIDAIHTNDSFICVSTDLPKWEGMTKDVYFLGTKRTFVINRDYSGDTTMDFWLREPAKTTGERQPITVQLLDVLAPRSPKLQAGEFRHYEFAGLIDKINIKVLNQDGSKFRTFTLIHPQVTNVEFGSNLTYEGDEGIKLTMTVHYEMWEQV